MLRLTVSRCFAPHPHRNLPPGAGPHPPSPPPRRPPPPPSTFARDLHTGDSVPCVVSLRPSFSPWRLPRRSPLKSSISTPACPSGPPCPAPQWWLVTPPVPRRRCTPSCNPTLTRHSSPP